MFCRSYKLRETERTRYLVVPEMEGAGAVHFFGLKASFQRPSDGPARFDGRRVFTTRQVHGDRVLVVERPESQQEISVSEDDALVTAEPGFFVGVYTADCLPILLSDPRRRVVAAVHAGWRGSVLGIAARAVEKMKRRFDCSPGDIRAAVGPAIGPCCYEVDGPVLEPIRLKYPGYGDVVRSKGEGKGMLDLLAFNGRQLLEAGLKEERLYAVGLCTACRKDLFSSYRGGGREAGGMLSGIMVCD